jgi:hypothetical protein
MLRITLPSSKQGWFLALSSFHLKSKYFLVSVQSAIDFAISRRKRISNQHVRLSAWIFKIRR